MSITESSRATLNGHVVHCYCYGGDTRSRNLNKKKLVQVDLYKKLDRLTWFLVQDFSCTNFLHWIQHSSIPYKNLRELARRFAARNLRKKLVQVSWLSVTTITVLLNTFTGTKAWVSGRTIGPSDYRTFGLLIHNPWYVLLCFNLVYCSVVLQCFCTYTTLISSLWWWWWWWWWYLSSSMRVGLVVRQQLSHFHAVVMRRHMQRRQTVLTLSIRTCTLRQEDLGDWHVAVLGCNVERSEAFLLFTHNTQATTTDNK